jgi:hypothetical protein
VTENRIGSKFKKTQKKMKMSRDVSFELRLEKSTIKYIGLLSFERSLKAGF